MKTTQAWGWLIAGVLAAGLNASYHDGGLEWAHQIADRVDHASQAVLALASGRADQFMAQARMLEARNETASDHLSGEWDRVQSQIDSRIDRSQAEFDRAQAIADREQARQQAQCDRFVASRARIKARIAAQAAHLRIAAFAPITMKSISAPVICPRVRMNVPRVPVVQLPQMDQISVQVSAGPV